MSGGPPLRLRPDLPVPPECRALIERGALVAVSHSAGKDSQCMTILLSRIVPREQLLVVHAPLGEVEWSGTVEHIEATLPAGVPLIMAGCPRESRCSTTSRSAGCSRESTRDGVRPATSAALSSASCAVSEGPSPLRRAARQLPRPAPRRERRARETRPLAAQRAHERRRARGLRLAADLRPLDRRRVPRHSPRGPVSALDLSPPLAMQCAFCIFSSPRGSAAGAELRPDLYRRYAEIERRTGHTLSPTRVPLPQLTGIPVEPAPAALRPCERLRLGHRATPSACP